MALSFHTVFLCKEETVNLYPKSACHERTHRIGSASSSIIMMKVRSNYGYYKCFQLFRSYKMNRLSHSNYSTPLSRSKEKSPICSINAFEEIERFDLRSGVNLILQKQWRQFIQLAIVLVCTFVVIPNVDAVDALKTCSCLLKECRIELAKCIANPSCAANVACLQTCNNRPDETECQIKCGDLFENSVVDQFNECAVSRKKCVPRKSDVGEFPVPDPSALVQSFNIKDFSGKWYITSGLNPTFDIFDCQLHEFHTEGDKLVGNLTWRIRTPDGGFFTRSAVQTFVQDPNLPGALYNHDNEFLHYQDDWYILSSQTDNKPDDYIFVYYRGRNDAWDGYGGAVLYTRSSTLPQTIVPRLQAATQSVGRNFDTFTITDNTCGPEPPLVERLEKKAEEGEKFIIKEAEEGEKFIIKEAEEIEEEVEKEVVKVRDTEVSLFQRLMDGFKELQKDEEYFVKELSKEEKEILNDLQMEASEVEKLFGRALPIRKLR